MNVMINGLPGNVAIMLAGHILADNRFELVPFSLTGPEITEPEWRTDTTTVALIRPEDKEQGIQQAIDAYGPFISVRFPPVAVNANARFYCAHHLPFVMGTTGRRPQ